MAQSCHSEVSPVLATFIRRWHFCSPRRKPFRPPKHAQTICSFWLNNRASKTFSSQIVFVHCWAAAKNHLPFRQTTIAWLLVVPCGFFSQLILVLATSFRKLLRSFNFISCNSPLSEKYVAMQWKPEMKTSPVRDERARRTKGSFSNATLRETGV